MAATNGHKPEMQSWAQAVPYSQEAEEAVIGAVLVDPSMYTPVAALLQADDFFLLRHRMIWRAMGHMDARNEPIDYILLIEELNNLKSLDEVGGAAYLTKLVNQAPMAYYAEVYAQLVLRTAQRRRYLQASDEIKRLALDESIAIDDVDRGVEKTLMQSRRVSSSSIISLKDAVSQHYDRTEAAMKNPNEILGIPSQIRNLNKYLRGYRNKKLYVLAGRPGMGKSSFLMTEAINMARNGIPVLLATLEVGQEEVTENIVAAEMGIPADVISTGALDANQWRQYVEVAGRISKWPLYVEDASVLTPMQLLLKARQMVYELGLRAVFVDYIQLMSGGGETKYSNRDQEIGYISRSLKEMAKTLNLPVLAAAQLSRQVENREDKRPMLSDLRESGNLEQDADVVMFFYRDDYYTKPTPAPKVSHTEIGIAKHRGGRTGKVDAGFYGELKKFVEIEQRELNIP